MKWDPNQYNLFSTERNQPFFDLLSRVKAESPSEVVDLGCGPGDLTKTLAGRWPNATVLGIDSSPEMIDRATQQNQSPPNLRFEVADARTWRPCGKVDVIISNALLQWIPTHRELLSQWASLLGNDSWLAFQVPGNFAADSHRLMAELAVSSRWRSQLDGVLRHDHQVSAPAEYLKIMQDKGFATLAWETTYLHVLTGPDPVLEWVRGTGLRPVLQALSATDAAEFEATYAARLRDAYPANAHGTVFAFRRIFCVGHKLN